MKLIKYSFIKTFRDKRNIIYILLLTICSIIILSSLLFKDIFINVVNDDYNLDSSYRGIIITPREIELDNYWNKYFFDDWGYEKVLNIPHVEGYYPQKNDELIIHKTTVDNKIIETLVFKNAREYNLPAIIKGNIINEDIKGEVVCEKYLYPNNIYDFSIKTINNIDTNKYLDMEDYIGENITIYQDIYDVREDGYDTIVYQKTYKLVGIYESKGLDSNHMTCYMSDKDISEVKSTTQKKDANSWNDYAIVYVDDKENLSSVSTEISKMGFKVRPLVEFDYYIDNIIKNICLIVVVISVCGIIVISILFAWKKKISDANNVALLKSLGYQNNDIIIYSLLKVLWISLISFAISLLLCEIVLLIGINYYDNLLFYFNISINKSIISYLLTILIIVLAPMISNYFLTKRLLTKNISFIRGSK